jgi:molybdate transport system substrate-binding protein
MCVRFYNYVATGNVDAGIVYRSDTVNNHRVEVVAIAPEKTYSPVVYPIAIIKDSDNHQAAQQMLQFLLTTEAQAIFQQHGFIPINN